MPVDPVVIAEVARQMDLQRFELPGWPGKTLTVTNQEGTRVHLFWAGYEGRWVGYAALRKAGEQGWTRGPTQNLQSERTEDHIYHVLWKWVEGQLGLPKPD